MKAVSDRGRAGIADAAYHAAGGDPLLALWLVLDLIWAGRLRASRSGIVPVHPMERLAA